MPRPDEASAQTICPFLGTLDDEGNPAPSVDYPSFENLCFVGDRPDGIMLTDQATFCLSSGHRHCPRLAEAHNLQSKEAANAATKSDFATTDRSDPILHAISDMEEALEARRRARARQKRRWGWIGAIAIFVSSLACGGLFAAYVGWQLVNDNAARPEPGAVTVASAPPAPAVPPVYLIVTATSESADLRATGGIDRPSSGEAEPPDFPPAVTPTPAIATPGGKADASVDRARAADATPSPSVRVDQSVLAAPAIDMLVQIPTRRPTPILDLSIAVPTVPQATANISPTPSPPLATPVVLFAAEDAELESGKCTTVSWHVENVRAVYYENLGVDGHGEQEECIRDKPGDYTLTVVLPNGATEYYTVTVGMILPTETPTPTPTSPPIVEPTATWTPVIPTDTPTPDLEYGVLLTVAEGVRHTCTPGTTCNIDLRLTNTSLAVDDIALQFIRSADWSARFCRLDGVCSDTKLTLASVGPSNTALVLFQVDVPKDASAKISSYTIRALSQGSGGDAGSGAVTIEITVEQ